MVDTIMQEDRDNAVCLDVSLSDLWGIIRKARKSIIIALILGALLPLVFIAMFPPETVLVAKIKTQGVAGGRARQFFSHLLPELRGALRNEKPPSPLAGTTCKTLPGTLVVKVPLNDFPEKAKIEKKFETLLQALVKRVNGRELDKYNLQLEEIRDNRHALLAIMAQLKKAILSGNYSRVRLTPLEVYRGIITTKINIKRLARKQQKMGTFIPPDYKVSYTVRKKMGGVALPALWFICMLITFTVTLAFHLCRFALANDR